MNASPSLNTVCVTALIFGFCVFASIFGILHGLLLFSFCCSSSPITSKKKLILSNGPGVVSTGPSPSEGLVLLVSDGSRPFASGCSCGAGVMDGTEKVRRRALSFFFRDVCWMLDDVAFRLYGNEVQLEMQQMKGKTKW